MNGVWFVLKKTLTRLLFPVGLVLVLGFYGLAVWLRRPRSRKGPLLVFASLMLLLTLSLPVTGGLMLRGLERQAGDYADPAELAALGVRDVVVLGGGVKQDRDNPGDRLTGGSLKRLLEGMRLQRSLPGGRLVLSGGNFGPGVTEAQAMADLARSLGAPADSMVLETKSWDTETEALRLAPILGKRPFALVTSAYHLPRAMAVFRARGMRPIPAPTDFRTLGFRLDYNAFIPQAAGLGCSEGAVYEYMGRAWVWLKEFLGL